MHLETFFLFPVSSSLYNDRLLLPKGDVETYFELINELFRFIDDDFFNALKQPDIRRHFPYIETSSQLNGEDVLEVAIFSETFKQIKQTINKRSDLPNLNNYLAEFHECYQGVEKEIFKIIDKNGSVKSNASPELLEIRKKVNSLEKSLRTQIQDYLTRRDMHQYLQDDFYTIRKERFVLPIKSNFKGVIKGIIHDRSNSGETIFIEPQEIVEINNNLVLYRKREIEEVKRILKQLTTELVPYLPSLVDMVNSYVSLDLVQARYQLSKKLDGHMVRFSKNFILDLKRVYNPLMQLEKKTVTPIDLKFDPKYKAMIISGPNAGGKTVALKTVGMIYLLVRSGILPPVEENGVICINNSLFCIIGDNQSIQADESSFTAHLTELDRAYKKASKNDLILVDEILQNTDPKTGSALALGFMEAATNRGARIILTTHYNELKYHALDDPAYLNVSVQLDQQMKPTFRLHYDQISESLPFEIARNLNISKEILNCASEYLEHNDDKVNRLVDNLNQKVKKYDHMVAELAREKQLQKKFETDRREFKMEKSRFMLKKESMLKKELDQTIQKLNAYVIKKEQTATKDVKNIVDKLKRQSTHKEKQIANLEDKGLTLSNEAPLKAETLEIGGKVFVRSMNDHGTIVNISRKKITVQTGTLKITTNIKDLSSPKSKSDVQLKKLHDQITRRLEDPKQPEERVIVDQTCVRTSTNTLDLIGKDTYDAEQEMDTFIDRLLYERKQFAFIIHGHGTGRLKQFIRSYLRDQKQVKQFRAAGRDDGGDAVTIIELRFS